MFKETFELYSLAKQINHEVFLDAQLQTAGSKQDQILEKMEKSNKYVRNQTIAMKLVFAIVLCFLPILPLITYFQMKDFIGSYGLHLSAAFLFSIFFGLNLLYIILVGMLNVSSFMSGNAFKWLRTLPIAEKRLKNIGFMTIFRNLDLPLIAITFSFPLIMGIITLDPLIALVSALTSVPNVIFGFSILIFIGERMSRVLYSEGAVSKKKSVIRMITMLSYIIMAMSLGFVMQWAFSSIDFFFEIFFSLENVSVINSILSLIPFPFGPSFLISIVSSPSNVSLGLWMNSIIGYILFLILTFIMYRGAINSLKSVIGAKKEKTKEVEVKEKKPKEVNIETRKPILALIRKDLITVSRDFQSFMFVLMPIVLPTIMIFSSTAALNLANIGVFDILIIWSFTISTCIYIPSMLISGFLNMEETGATILASLPIIPRDQAKAKIFTMLIIQTVSFLAPPLILVLITGAWMIFFLILFTVPISWTCLLLIFELKIRLFGKMKYKYVIEEINRSNKVLKWILIFLVELAVIFFYFLIVLILLLLSIELWIISMVILGVGLSSTLILVFIFNKMFPKLEEIGDYKTGGALRESPILGVIVLTILYAIFVFSPQFIEGIILLPFINDIPFLTLLFIDFGFTFGFLGLLWFYIVPFGLKLPYKEQKFKQYLENIGLGKNQPYFRNLIIGIGSFIIFITISLLGGILLGNYIFIPEIIFGTPTVTNFGWFLFIYMLIPGIWEEVSFRGVLIPNLQRKYSELSIILLSGCAFGLAHSMNFINVLVGLNPWLVVLQINYAAFLGFAFAYMFLRTKSLIPCIILHYLIDSLGQLFLYVQFSNWFALIIYFVFFIGIVPMILIVLFVKYSTKINIQKP
ncbi:MAG: CPBP family intramembrane metalloprotease [Promethearchaeota archaeon]|nr:MAG: CPBP family intramembrane metalloprotease [Candidatus Lokiarchaeota archaeon]